MDEKMSLEDLAQLFIGRIVEPWVLPQMEWRTAWTLEFTLNSEMKYQIKLTVRNIESIQALELARRLEQEFTILECEISGRRGLTTFLLGHNWIRRTEDEFNDDERHAPVAD